MMRTVLFLLLLSFSSVSIADEPATHLSITKDGLSGSDLYEGRCAGACHQSPPLRALSPKQWRVVLATMQKRMVSRNIPQLTDDETEVLLQYLTAKSSK